MTPKIMIWAALKLKEKSATPNVQVPKRDDQVRRYLQLGAAKALAWAAEGGEYFGDAKGFSDMIDDIIVNFNDIESVSKDVGVSKEALEAENEKYKEHRKQILRGN